MRLIFSHRSRLKGLIRLNPPFSLDREAKINPLLKVDIMRASNIKLIKNFVDEVDEQEKSRQLKIFGRDDLKQDDEEDDKQENEWVHDEAILNPNFASG